MKIVREDYNETIKAIASGCLFTRAEMENLEYLSKCEDKERMHELFGFIEYNYDHFHKHDVNNKSFYMLKAVSLIRDYGPMFKNMSCNCLSLLVTEFPFYLDRKENIDRFKALASDELLAGIRVLSNRYKPIDMVCSFLQHYDENRYKITNDEELQRFRDYEMNFLMEDKQHYFLTHYSTEKYIAKVRMEGISRDGHRTI